jgi:hypothetical protein
LFKDIRTHCGDCFFGNHSPVCDCTHPCILVAEYTLTLLGPRHDVEKKLLDTFCGIWGDGAGERLFDAAAVVLNNFLFSLCTVKAFFHGGIEAKYRF